MHLNSGNRHLTYCSNIHPGESLEDVEANLQQYLPPLKQALSPNAPFGVGLRLSAEAATQLEEERLELFKSWLDEQGCYAFTMNGFPYGGFHRQVVKDTVYQPDWRTRERVVYTVQLAHIMAALVPEGMEAGISTSPLSYKPWLASAEAAGEAFHTASVHLAEVAEVLAHIEAQTDTCVHVDIEPEPDCLIENSQETIAFFKQWLLPVGGIELAGRLGVTRNRAEELLLRHIRLCYDTCHFAVEYESPAVVLPEMRAAGIRVGKVQISAALKSVLPADAAARAALGNELAQYAESTYLHQVIERHSDGRLYHYDDLPDALPHIQNPAAEEWRIHYHVPVFVDDFGPYQSTQSDIVDAFDVLLKDDDCTHYEIETYTWEVLPDDLKLDLHTSIKREYDWVLAQMA